LNFLFLVFFTFFSSSIRSHLYLLCSHSFESMQREAHPDRASAIALFEANARCEALASDMD
jgi:hypothetical protein